MQPPLVSSEAAPAPVELKAEPTPNNAARFAATFAGALVGAAPAIGVIVLGAALCGRDQGCAYASVMGGILAAPLTTALGAFLAHRFAGGNGTFGKAMAGAAIGLGLGVVGSYLLGTAARSSAPESNWAIATTGAMVAFLITAAMLEYSHHNESKDLGVALAPTAGGAMVTLGGRF